MTAASAPADERQLDDLLSRPTPGVLEVLRHTPGDLLILGAGGKMGPTLCLTARRALDQIGSRARVIAVSRFTDRALAARLGAAGIRTIAVDLLDSHRLATLPDAPNLVFMAGQKFGATDAPGHTWAMNAVLPARVAERFPAARTVVFSTGNVYPLTPPVSGGASETCPPAPLGDYALSCLARERAFAQAAATRGTPVTIARVNYANDLRYGVLVDTALRVRAGRPVPLQMGWVNLIWQGDANARALQCLGLAASPAAVLNLTGPETVSIRWLAERFARRFGVTPAFEGEEAADALLSNASRSVELFGPPEVSLDMMIDWTADWIERGGRLLHKPTKFEARDGRF